MGFKKRAMRPEEDPTSLGNLLVKAGVCTESQLREAIAVKRQRDDTLLGETMVRMGIITHDMLKVVLEQQQLLRVSGTKRAVYFANKAARSTLTLSGNIAALNEVALQALSKLKT